MEEGRNNVWLPAGIGPRPMISVGIDDDRFRNASSLQTKALSPVTARPTTSVLISRVPS
jgi:hypothetical protein